MQMEHIDLMHDVKFSQENVINHIPLTFLNEKLCLKSFSFHPFMIHENNIDEVNLEPIIIKIFFLLIGMIIFLIINFFM